MFDADLAFPFTLGLVAAFNPCGFAMLPVYVSFFLGKNSESETSTPRSLLRALRVGAALTAGFVAVFGAFGILTSSLLSSGSVLEYTPYVTFGLGILLIPMGIAMVFFGFELKLSTPRLEAGGDSGEMWSMFLFGVSYAIVSLGCTVGLFIAGVSSVFTSDGFFDGVSVFVAYGLGMGAVIMTLTIALALARTSIATNMRKILPWVNRISGVLLTLSGAYLIVYGWWEIQVLRGNYAQNGLVSFFENMQTEVNIWIDQTGPTRLGTGLLLIVGLAMLRATWGDLFGVPAARELAESSAQNAARVENEHGSESEVMKKATADQKFAARSLNRRLFFRRRLLTAFVAVWVLLEFGKAWNGERANLFILPTIRTIIDIPERFGNWFSDPLRWGVLGELLIIAIIAWTVWSQIRKRRPGAESITPAMA